jgi:hypothetical protein
MEGLIGLVFLIIIFSIAENWNQKDNERLRLMAIRKRQEDKLWLRHLVSVWTGKIKH